VSGAGSARLGGLVARHASVRVSGAGLVAVTATGTLDASVSGAVTPR
jgi:Putative auto-transporter adhesin, head GIN domain